MIEVKKLTRAGVISVLKIKGIRRNSGNLQDYGIINRWIVNYVGI